MTQLQPTSSIAIVDGSPGVGGALTSAAALAELLRGAGTHVSLWHTANLPRTLTRMFSLSARFGGVADRAQRGLGYVARELARAAMLVRSWQQVRPDIIVLNNAPGTNWAGALAADWLGIPYVLVCRSDFHVGRIAKRVLQGARRVFTVGEAAHARVTQNGVAALRLTEGLSPSQWPTAREPQARSLFFAASSASWKGLRLALDAYVAAKRIRVMPTFHVCVASDGNELDIGELPSGVILHRDADNIDGIRKKCAVYVHASLQPEPFGRALLEAMAAGLCAIVPSEGNPKLLVRDQVDGLHYAPRDVQALSVTMVRAVADVELAECHGAAGQARAAAYTAEATFGEMVRLLQLLSGARARARSQRLAA